MKRREFITLLGGAVTAWPFAARTQQAAALIGFLASGAADSFAIFCGRLQAGNARQRDGRGSRLLTRPTFCRRRRAAQRATSTIPIVMTGLIDPVGQGLIASLARPGGNTSGLANLAQDVMPKLVEILRGTFPAIRNIAVLFNPANPANRELSKVILAQANSIDVTVRLVEFGGASELDATFAALGQQPPEALVVVSDAALYDLRGPISALALKHRLPTIAYVPEFTDAGSLMSYGPPRRAMYHRAAGYVKKIMTGARPAELPVEQPTQVELSINLGTAKALGITIPDTVLARADRVIE